jgi:hypothetical protein
LTGLDAVEHEDLLQDIIDYEDVDSDSDSSLEESTSSDEESLSGMSEKALTDSLGFDDEEEVYLAELERGFLSGQTPFEDEIFSDYADRLRSSPRVEAITQLPVALQQPMEVEFQAPLAFTRLNYTEFVE